jgi:hypothetical protein
MLSRREALASLAAMPTIGLAEAQAQNQFYAGKTLNIIVGSSKGYVRHSLRRLLHKASCSGRLLLKTDA